ncbi:hypothetical protein E3C22_20315 [Jiella endophytica]|uniref:Uncharacterized protein n=1 Tax=Jiella endophytica TaxID=2558362 RepID=A0A4Y8RBI0_9HYPH|nr:hypothetical protein [Jiella endophytica]TFF19119.1 hypothetical protein E3C22_20315 [Jiella endophytica]
MADDNIVQFPDGGGPRDAGGAGGGDGMEARVAKLEAGVGHIEQDVSELRTDMKDVRDRLARLEERVSHLPGKGFIVTALIIGFAVTAGLVTFQSRIQSFVTGPKPSAASSTSQPGTP